MRDEILNFSRICHVPQTFCAIDGSHIEIKAPLECKEDFFNRKNTTALFYRELLMQA